MYCEGWFRSMYIIIITEGRIITDSTTPVPNIMKATCIYKVLVLTSWIILYGTGLYLMYIWSNVNVISITPMGVGLVHVSK